MSRLIDADEVKRFYNEEFPTLDNGVHWSRNDIIMNLSNIPTVKAIPIDWIEKWGRRNTWYYGNKDNVITTLLREWNCKQRVEQANEMLEKWDKENETTGKN